MSFNIFLILVIKLTHSFLSLWMVTVIDRMFPQPSGFCSVPLNTSEFPGQFSSQNLGTCVSVLFRKQKPRVTLRIRDVNTLTIIIFDQHWIPTEFNLKPYLALFRALSAVTASTSVLTMNICFWNSHRETKAKEATEALGFWEVSDGMERCRVGLSNQCLRQWVVKASWKYDRPPGLPQDWTHTHCYKPTMNQKHTRSALHPTNIPWAPTESQVYAWP